jgi:hypothetical protein
LAISRSSVRRCKKSVRAREMIDRSNARVELSVDGGIDATTAPAGDRRRRGCLGGGIVNLWFRNAHPGCDAANLEKE